MAEPWLPVPPCLSLEPAELHLFRFDIRLRGAPEILDDWLDDEEKSRARRFHFDDDRRRFISAHGQMRQVLSWLLNTGREAVRYHKNGFGKPYLPGSELQFNLSHSGEMALFGVILGRAVGVDIESMRRRVEVDPIASRFFSPFEVRELLILPPDQRAIGFFQCWTRKEAYIKARGLGLKIPLGQFSVTLGPGVPPRLVQLEPDAPNHWSMIALEPGEGYAGAAVVEGDLPSVHYWDWIT